MKIDPSFRQKMTGEPLNAADRERGPRWQASDIAWGLARGAFALAILWAAGTLFPYYYTKIASGLSSSQFDSIATASTIMLAACVGEACILLRQIVFVAMIVAWIAIFVAKIGSGALDKLETWLT